MSESVKYAELEAQIAARGIKKSAIAAKIGCSYRALADKLSGKSRFTWEEVLEMNRTFFPDMSPIELMRTESGT